MTAALKDNTIDVAIGLTEGFVADLGKTAATGEKPEYGLVGTYVESPLCWAISAGGKGRISDASELDRTRCGISRIGRLVKLHCPWWTWTDGVTAAHT